MCTIPGASCNIDNIEEMFLPLGHIPEQYFFSYFSLPHEVCDYQQEYTHQLGGIFSFLLKNMERITKYIENAEFRLNGIHYIDKKM